MIKEPKNVDFYTTGRQLSEEDFARISDWIKDDKKKLDGKKKPAAKLSGRPALSELKEAG